MVKIEQLLEAGVHFGHRVTKWNPRMAPFIFGERNGIHIIDLIQTLNYLDEASKFLEQLGRGHGANNVSGGAQSLENNNTTAKQILFVGTKKQASNLIEVCANKINGVSASQISLENSLSNSWSSVGETTANQDGNKLLNTRVQTSGNRNPNLSAHYVNHRWLGGLLTNWSTMKICIDQLNDLEKRESNGELQTLPKKERSILKKQHEKLNKFFGGIKNLKQRPDVVIIVGQDIEMNAVRECNKLQNTTDLSDSSSGTSSRVGLMSNNSRMSTQNFPGTKRKGDFLGSGKLRTITLLDTNCDPSLADIFVPANDDSTKSLELILGQFTSVLSN